MSQYPLFDSGRAVFGADGTARVVIGPTRAFETWHIVLMNISTTSVLATSCKIYRGQQETPSSQVDVSRYNGNNDTSDSKIDLTPAERILAVWAGGTPGAAATITVSGTSERA